MKNLTKHSHKILALAFAASFIFSTIILPLQAFACHGTISGIKFNDINGDGQRNPLEEGGLAGWTITIEGTEYSDSTVTDDQGNYSFPNLIPGFYTVCEVLQEGWEQTSPGGNGCHTVEIIEDDESGIDFGNRQIPPLNIYAYKVVCESEEYLPNWTTDPNNPSQITETTATDYVDGSDGKCWLESNWYFQWGFNGEVTKQSGEFIGAAPGWSDFDSPTSETTPATVQIDDLGEHSQIWVRENLKEGYVPFTYPPKGGIEDDVSAELLCHTDGYKYDNYDAITSLVSGEDYYCVAFNAPLPPECNEQSGDWTMLDNVDIGETVSEVSHPIDGWSEANLPGNYGGCGDGSCTYRQLLGEPGSGQCTESERDATTILHAENNTVSKLKVKHLDGISLLDSFDVFVNDILVGHFTDDTQIQTEVWRETEFDLTGHDFSGDLTIKLVSTDDIWTQCPTYGQVAIDFIELYGCGEPWNPDPFCGDGNLDPGEKCEIDHDCCQGTCNYETCLCEEEPPPFSCKFNINFIEEGYENWNTGDVDENIFVGIDPTPFALGEWISLEETDADLTNDVPGIAVQRLADKLKVYLYGSHSDGGKEAVHGLVTIEGGKFTSIENVTGAPYEKWDDDTYIWGNAGQDEAYFDESDPLTSEFATIVTTHDDAYYIYYTCGTSECIPEGGSGAVVPGALECCEGLTQIGCDQPDQYGECSEECVGAFYCTNCGDGICGLGENKCNCPEDCDTSTLFVIKNVTGGTATTGDFMIYVSGNNPSSTSFPGEESPGTEVTLDPGEYVVTESTSSDYISLFSADCANTITAGETKTCTITNTYQSECIVATPCSVLGCNRTDSCGNYCGDCPGGCTILTPCSDLGCGKTDSCGNYCGNCESTYCGDGIINGDEECDGTDGAPEGYTCTDSCILEKIICKMDLDVMMIMDVSGSMGYNSPTRLSQAKIAANNFIDNLRDSDQSGLVSFSWTATLNKELSNDHISTKSSIDGLIAGGATNIGDAVDEANQELMSIGNSPEIAKIEILLTDGRANQPNGNGSEEDPTDLALALSESVEAAENDIVMFTIGLGNDINTTMLQNMAQNTGGEYYFAPTSNDLDEVFDQIASETCKDGSTTSISSSVTIFDARILAVSNTSVTVSWLTNIPATSRVVYDTIPHPEAGDAPNYGYAWSTPEDDTKTIFHTATITGLIPGTSYYWRAISRSSPEKLGDESTFSTEFATPTSPVIPEPSPESPSLPAFLPGEESGTFEGPGEEESKITLEEGFFAGGLASIIDALRGLLGGNLEGDNIYLCLILIIIILILIFLLWLLFKRKKKEKEKKGQTNPYNQ